ncbi:MAG: molybdopterin-dependent oxidoreductase [Gaiellaceae bacterium]
MSAPELVTVTIDDVEVQVPKGTGVVETALAAGIEIPVFCYEPRLGPPVGACRMCLCEVEGMPKMQTACTMTATDGMVVHSALSSPKAAEAQNSTLEFILVNHPLDCPICDKGGECPLQDLTFRYGPGSTRMHFPKRTLEKPIPISPTIALDRERCILCYRCTRFSESVAEDMQLVALNRGALSMIATFEDEPYVGAFSGNVIELCPVGALTSTQYRFEARPWEIQNAPTVCGLCPVGCNISATTREGKVKRILSRNHPEVDDGWLCDKGRFAFSHIYASDRITEPRRRVGAQAFTPAAWDDALDEAERLLRQAGTHIVTALSGTETVEQAYALAKLLRRGLGAHAALLPEIENARALDAFRRPLSSIRDADVIAILGDEPLAESAPIVDLWVRAAKRIGAEVLYELDGEKLRAAERAVVIGSAELDDAALAADAERVGAWAAFHIPRAANSRGVCEAWAAASDEEEAENPDPVRLLVISGDEALANPAVRALAEHAEHVLVFAMFDRPTRGVADLVLPGTSYLEREGTYVNLEGRLQRLRRAVVPPAPDELAWISGLAERFSVDLSPYAAGVFDELSALIYDGLAFSQVGERAPLPLRSAPEPETAEPQPARPQARTADANGALRLVAYRPLFSGPAVERVPELQFQRAQPVLEIAADDARARGIRPGDEVEVRSNGTSARLRARVSRTLARGTVRAADEHVDGLPRDVEVTRA